MRLPTGSRKNNCEPILKRLLWRPTKPKELKTITEELVGIIEGTGLGDALAESLSDATFHDVNTPFGKPSTSIMLGRLGDRRIAFLNRHGAGHKLSPSEIPFAANIVALKKLGVHTLIRSRAVDSLTAEIQPIIIISYG